MASLEDLPAELILLILDYLDPASHLDFGLTNPFIADVAKDVFANHRKCHDELRNAVINVANDDGSTGRLFRKVTSDPLAAWHIRKLEIRDERTEHGMTYLETESDDVVRRVDSAMDDVIGLKVTAMLPTRSPTPSPTDSEPRENAFTENGYTYMNALHMTRARLKQGRTTWKQALCIAAQCPRLATLVVVVRELNEDEHYDYDSESCLDFIGHALHYQNIITAVYNMPWPRGFQSLRTVVLEEPPPPGVWPVTACPYFFLPWLSTIHIHNMITYDAIFHTGLQDRFDPHTLEGCSGVQNIVFSVPYGDPPGGEISALLYMPRTLRSFVCLDNGVENIDHIVNIVASQHGRTLENLVFNDSGESVPVESPTRYSWTNLELLSAIRVLAVDVLDMMPASTRRSTVEEQHGEETPEQFLERFATSIPPTVEVLILLGPLHQSLNDAEMHRIGDALTHLIDSKRCPKLAAIYADELELRMNELRCQWGTLTNGGWFQSPQDYARERGVEMFTLGERGKTSRYLHNLAAHLGEEGPMAEFVSRRLRWQ